MLSATSFQITLLSGQNWQTDLQLYVLGGVFLAASTVWYTMFRLKPSVYVLAAPWLFFGLAFLLIGLPGISLRLWLGVLNAIQGVGLGMILLQVPSLYISYVIH
jgi:alpha-1,3-glucan synthase